MIHLLSVFAIVRVSWWWIVIIEILIKVETIRLNWYIPLELMKVKSSQPGSEHAIEAGSYFGS